MADRQFPARALGLVAAQVRLAREPFFQKMRLAADLGFQVFLTPIMKLRFLLLVLRGQLRQGLGFLLLPLNL